MPKQTEVEKLIEMMAEENFNRLFPEFKGDMRHPLNKSLEKKCKEDAVCVLRVMLKSIEDGKVVDWAYKDDIKQICLKPEFKEFLEAK